MRIVSLILLVVAALVALACTSGEPASTPTTTPEPTSAPTPDIAATVEAGIAATIVSLRQVPKDEPWLYTIDERTITYIKVEHSGKSAEYARDSVSDQWMILGEPDYPVFQQKWDGTPLLLSGPRVNQGLKETIDNPADYGLDPPESVVQVADRSGNIFEFHIGIPTPDDSN